jgi:hypothetical protein
LIRQGIKLFNCLPLSVIQLYKDVKRFILKLKEFLNCHSFYTLVEYFEYSSWKDWLYAGCFMHSNSLYFITSLYLFTCLYFRIITILTSYSVLLILYWLFHIQDCIGFYGNKDDDDDDDDDNDNIELTFLLFLCISLNVNHICL